MPARPCPNCGFVKSDPVYDREVGEKLRRMRAKAGLSIVKTAELAHCSPSIVGAIERGERKASRRIVDRIVAAIKQRAEEARALASVEEYENAEAERRSPLCVQEPEGELVDRGQPSELPIA